MQMFREHGQAKKYYHDVVGWNGRMDGLQAAVLSVKLKYLDQANDSRRRAAKRYNELLAGTTSKRVGCSTKRAHRMSMCCLSTVMPG